MIRGVVVATTLLLGCGPTGGTVELVLDIPNAMLDPKGFSSVEVRLHHADGDTEFNVGVVNGQFDLGAIEIQTGVMIEASLRTETGVAVGYGRAAAAADLRDGERIVIPVRRPIIYFAGVASRDADNNPQTPELAYASTKPTFSDLATGTFLDGTTKLAENAVMTVAAGPNLYLVDQPVAPMTGDLMGTPTIRPVSTGDHAVTAALPAQLAGVVQDAAGSDDGRLLLIGTSTQLFVVNTESGMARPVTDGSFSRVAIVSAANGALTAIAIRNRSATGACTAELVWVAVNDDDTNQVMPLATGGFTDVAGDVGRAFYVDSCKNELGEATASGITSLRAVMNGKPTALAVSNGQAWIGLERPSATNEPAEVALIQASLVGTDAPRTLFDEPATQVVEAIDFRGVQRALDSKSISFMQLEVGAGGDYIATTLAATYDGQRVDEANFPRIEIETQELRVLDASTGATVQHYRSWCDGIYFISDPFFDIYPWGCATAPGQLAPTAFADSHRINSMSFQYGKK